MIEVEMKFQAAEAEELVRRLRALGGQRQGMRRETDHYFRAPDRDFVKTDEALRLRQMGDQNVLTYKGPKQDAQTKTRTEIEVPLSPGDQAAERLKELLDHLGYQLVATLHKDRTVYAVEHQGFSAEVCFDQVEGLGPYLELEIVVPQAELEAARQAVLDLASRLGLGQTERRSYLELWLGRRGTGS